MNLEWTSHEIIAHEKKKSWNYKGILRMYNVCEHLMKFWEILRCNGEFMREFW